MSTIVADTICDQAGNIAIDTNELVTGCCQGWINLSGIGPVSTAFTIRDQYGINAVIDLDVGNYRFFFTQTLPNNRYVININIARTGGAGSNSNFLYAEVDVPSMSVSSFDIITNFYGLGSPADITSPFDPDGIYISCYASQNSLFLP